MPLQFKNIAVGNLQDDVSGNNYAANKAVYILNLNNTLAQIFSDESGTIPIVQDGVNNVTGAKGVFGFWVEAGDYFVQVGANKYRVSITGADYFNNRVDETVNLIVDAVAGRGAYYVVGSFEAGFTYTDINQVGTFGGTDYYIYTGGLTNLPSNVTAGTNPTLSGDYKQVTFNSIDGVSGLRDELNDRAAYLTIAEAQAQASDLQVGQYIRFIDRGYGLFRITSGVSSNDMDRIDLGAGLVAISEFDGWLDPAWWGASEGTDSSAVFARMNVLGVTYINFNGRTLYATSTCKFSDKVVIIGGKLVSVNTDVNTPALWLQGDDSVVDWLEVDGKGVEAGEDYPTLAFNNSGIRVSKESPGESNFVRNVSIGDDVTVENMRGEGILLSHVVGLKLGSPTVRNCGYAGILGISVIDSKIDSPIVDTIQDKDGYQNHYGITLTRNLSTSLVDDPRSTNVQVGKPIIKNVFNWIGFDIHAGVNIHTEFVRCYNCKIPFNIQYDSATPGLRNNSENITLNGYGESFNDETSGIGCAILGLSDSKNENVKLDLLLKNCGDVSGSQTGAVVIDNNNNISGNVTLIGSKRVGMSLIGDNDEIQINLDQQGVTWTDGSSFYLYTDAATQTNVKITGRWGYDTAGSSTGADIGVFYTGAQPSNGAILFDKVRIRLGGGSTWLSDGANANKAGDFSWTAEASYIALPNQLTVGGAQYDQFLGDLSTQFDRIPDIYLDDRPPKWYLYDPTAGAFDLGIRTFANNTSPAVYKLDGTNVPAGQQINVGCELAGVFFSD